jgi:hypothetical protein
MAAQNGHIDVVQLLLSPETDINKTYKFGATMLYIASSKGHSEIVKILLERGADTEVTCQDRCTVIDVFITVCIALHRKHSNFNLFFCSPKPHHSMLHLKMDITRFVVNYLTMAHQPKPCTTDVRIQISGEFVFYLNLMFILTKLYISLIIYNFQTHHSTLRRNKDMWIFVNY